MHRPSSGVISISPTASESHRDCATNLATNSHFQAHNPSLLVSCMINQLSLVYSQAFRVFETVLQDYEKQKSIALVKYLLTEQLQNFDSVESVFA